MSTSDAGSRPKGSRSREGAAQARLPGVVLGRADVPAFLGETVPRGDGAARPAAADGSAPFRRLGRRARLLPAPPRRPDVAAEGALRWAGVLPRFSWRAVRGGRGGPGPPPRRPG